MYLAMSHQADRESYPKISETFKRYAWEEAEHTSKMLSPSGRAGIAEMESGLAGRGRCPEGGADILAAALFLGAAHSCLRN